MQNTINLLLSAAIVVLLSNCSTVQSDVTRFHTLPPRGSGETFTVQSASSRSALEFGAYATRIASHLQAYGWSQAPLESANYIVLVDYKIGGSHERHGSLPIMGQTGGGTTYHSGSVNTYGSYGSSYGTFSGTSYTPATYGVVGAIPYSITLHNRYLKMEIRDRDGRAVFEGRVASTGPTGEIAAVLPEMIDALFSKFPGESGETKRIETVSQ